MFKFEGSIQSSKSLVNRALIVQSYEPAVEVRFLSESEDVQVLQKSLLDFKNGQTEFYCADAGTAFRFLVLRLARVPGRWTVVGTPRLLSRPQQGLLQLLEQLSVEVETLPDRWILQSQGWKHSGALHVPAQSSSQFASAVFLNCWQLSEDLELHMDALSASQGYLEMTLQMVRHFGLKIQSTNKGYKIAAGQSPLTKVYDVESDVSSCFALASCAVQGGSAQILKFPFDSLQPDLVFLDIFKKMKATFERADESLKVEKTDHLQALQFDCQNSPDLFPVLAVLCARAQGTSCLQGFQNLSAKESDRLKNTQQLLQKLGQIGRAHV